LERLGSFQKKKVFVNFQKEPNNLVEFYEEKKVSFSEFNLF